jgi:protein gp37
MGERERGSAPYRSQINHPRQINAAVKFLSIKPPFSDLGVLNLEDIVWIIIGEESIPDVRPLAPAWMRSIRDQCAETGIPFFLFFKQWGGVGKKRTGKKS